MEKERLYNTLYQHKSLSEQDITEIKIFIDRYPYFSIPYILLAKHYKKHESLKEISLRMAAIYVPNRTRLKKILNEEPNMSRSKNDTYLSIKVNNKFIEENIHQKQNNIPICNTNTVTLKGKNDEIEQAQPDLAKESSILSSNIYSENLAKILNKQGKIEEAKEIYKKLILKFPKKSSYFTSMIEEIG